MRGLSRSFLILSLAGWALTAHADDASTGARTIIEEAVRANGGVDRLARTLSMTRTGKCEVFGLDKPIKGPGEYPVKLPGLYRWSAVFEVKGGKTALQNAISGDKGLRLRGRRTQGFEQAGTGRVSTDGLRHLARRPDAVAQERTFELSPVPPVDVGGNPAVGVKVSAKDRPDVKLFFDKTTHLLAKVEWKGKYAGLTRCASSCSRITRKSRASNCPPARRFWPRGRRSRSGTSPISSSWTSSTRPCSRGREWGPTIYKPDRASEGNPSSDEDPFPSLARWACGSLIHHSFGLPGSFHSSLKKPALTMPPGVRDVRRHAHVHDGPVGQLRHLAGVVQVVVFAEREAAVEDDVMLAGSADWDRSAPARACPAGRRSWRRRCTPLRVPADRQLAGDLRQHGVAARDRPTGQVAGGDVGVGDVRVVLHARRRRGTACASGRWRGSSRCRPIRRPSRSSACRSAGPSGSESMKASSIGPCRPWRFAQACRPRPEATSVQPLLPCGNGRSTSGPNRPAAPELLVRRSSRAAWPSIRAGSRRLRIANVNAVTFEVSAETSQSSSTIVGDPREPAPSAFPGRRS